MKEEIEKLIEYWHKEIEHAERGINQTSSRVREDELNGRKKAAETMIVQLEKLKGHVAG